MRDAAQSSAWNEATWVDPRTAALREALRKIAPGAHWSAIGQGALDIMRAAAELSAAELGPRKKDRKPLQSFARVPKRKARARVLWAQTRSLPLEWLTAVVLEAAKAPDTTTLAESARRMTRAKWVRSAVQSAGPGMALRTLAAPAGGGITRPTQALRLQWAAGRVCAQTKTNHPDFEHVAFAFVVLRAAFTLRDDLRAETIAGIARGGVAGVVTAIPADMFGWLPTDTLPMILFDVCREAPAAIPKDERRLWMHTNGNGKVAGSALPYVRGVLAALRMRGFVPDLTRWPVAWRHAHELLKIVVERLDEYSRCHE